jgi:hypothetical protein
MTMPSTLFRSAFNAPRRDAPKGKACPLAASAYPPWLGPFLWSPADFQIDNRATKHIRSCLVTCGGCRLQPTPLSAAPVLPAPSNARWGRLPRWNNPGFDDLFSRAVQGHRHSFMASSLDGLSSPPCWGRFFKPLASCQPCPGLAPDHPRPLPIRSCSRCRARDRSGR